MKDDQPSCEENPDKEREDKWSTSMKNLEIWYQ